MNAAPRFRMKQTSSKNQGQVYFGEHDDESLLVDTKRDDQSDLSLSSSLSL